MAYVDAATSSDGDGEVSDHTAAGPRHYLPAVLVMHSGLYHHTCTPALPLYSTGTVQLHGLLQCKRLCRCVWANTIVVVTNTVTLSGC